MNAHNEQQARALLALGLDEFGHHTEAANVRKGIDLDDYKVDLWAIRAALDAQPAAAQEAVGEVAEWEGTLCVQWVPNYEPPVGTQLFAAPVTAAPAEMSPEFTDTARAAIAWVLWHHQGGSSPVGQPLRFALGMGADEPLPDWRIAEAKRYAAWAGATTDRFHDERAITPAAPGIDMTPFRLLVEGCEAEFTGAETEELEPDDSKVSYPEDRCHITFGMIRNARKALDASPNGGSEARDAARLDWLDANGFTAYRQVDPIDGLSGHCVVVHETMTPRRGNVYDTIRGAIDAAMQAQAGDAEVQP